MLSIFIMILLNIIVKKLECILAIYFPSVHQEPKFSRNKKRLAISIVILFIMRRCIPSEKLAMDVWYLVYFLLSCICQLKCSENQDKLWYIIGYLSFINEYKYAKVKNQEMVKYNKKDWKLSSWYCWMGYWMGWKIMSAICSIYKIGTKSLRDKKSANINAGIFLYIIYPEAVFYQ